MQVFFNGSAAKNKISVKLRIIRKDRKYVPVLFNGILTEDNKGNRRIYCVIMDISEQERLMEKILLEQEKYRILAENSGEIIFQIDCRENKSGNQKNRQKAPDYLFQL